MSSEMKQTWDVQALCIYVVPIIVALSTYLLKNQIRIYWTAFQLNGPIGNAYALTSDTFVQKLTYTSYKEYGPIFRLWLGIYPYVFITKPDDVQKVLGNAKHVNKSIFYFFFQNFLGHGLTTSESETWRNHRKLLTPAFHHSILKKFIGPYVKYADRLTDGLAKMDGQKLDITKIVNSLVYQIVLETVLGVDVTSTGKENGNADTNDMVVIKGQILLAYRLTRPWLYPDILYKLTSYGQQDVKQGEHLKEMCRRMLERKRRLLKEKESKQEFSFLEYMIELNKQKPESFTNEDIISQCGSFLLAGLDSVSTTVAMTAFLLANHPHWQDTCHEELVKIFAEGDANRSPSMQDLNAMKWMEYCIKEALRLYPSAPLISRKLESDVEFGGRVIPAGTSIMVPIIAIQRSSDSFSDPHSFRPERFSDGSMEKIHPFAYMPFSAGPRNCIGSKLAFLQVKTILSAILRRYHLSSVEGKTEVNLKFRLSLRASGGLWVKITQRTAKNDGIHSEKEVSECELSQSNCR